MMGGTTAILISLLPLIQKTLEGCLTPVVTSSNECIYKNMNCYNVPKEIIIIIVANLDFFPLQLLVL